jgi:protein arginine N-methyltransferase 1
MYPFSVYGSMISDCVRTPPYIRAIEAAVRQGSIVVDVGCGSGFFALVACRAGARRIYAIDEADIIHLAEKFAVANSFADQLVFLQGDSRQIQLPERADVIVSDVRGSLPLFGNSLVSLIDARERFLRDGGIIIPQRDVLYAALVEDEPAYREITSPWGTRVNGMDLSPALSCVLNEMHRVYVEPQRLISDPQAWCVIDYTKSLKRAASATLLFRAERAARGHGVLIWFETKLYEDIGFSSAPGNPKSVYSHMLLPWLEPLLLSAGQDVHLDLHADLVGADYIWRWETKTCDSKSGKVHHFKQSTLQGALLSAQSLRKHAADFVPTLSPEGEAERWLLQAIDGSTPLQAIAEHASQRFPNVFRRTEDAFRRVTLLVERFSR